jgi:hypothetical protein
MNTKELKMKITTKPIATIIREALPEGAWRPGWSKTYKDISYTKTQATTRWASKYLGEIKEPAKVKRKIKRLLGKDYVVWVMDREINVYATEPITITHG